MSTSRPRTRRHPLSRRRVRTLIAIGQSWQHIESGKVRVVRQIWRKDGMALMVSERGEIRTPTFAVLGSEYRLLEGEP